MALPKGLDKDKLKDNLKQAFDETCTEAYKQAYLATLQRQTKKGNKHAERFAETLTEMIHDTLAQRMADIIHAYVKNMQINGQMILLGVNTVGSMTAQSQVVPLSLKVTTQPEGLLGGTIPGLNNFILGIS